MVEEECDMSVPLELRLLRKSRNILWVVIKFRRQWLKKILI